MSWCGRAALVLALGCLATAVRAEEFVWRPAKRPVNAAQPFPIRLGPPELWVRAPAAVRQASFVQDPDPPALAAGLVVEVADAEPPGGGGQVASPSIIVAPATPEEAAALEEAQRPPPGVIPADAVESPFPLDTWDRLPALPPGYTPEDFGGLPPELVLNQPIRIYASAEYLLWWFRGDRVPPLATTAPLSTAN